MDKVFLKLQVALDRPAGLLVAPDGSHDITGVLHSIDITKFGSVVGGNRHFFYRVALVLQFDDDFRVEMKIICHVGEVDTAQRVQIICPITAVELGKVKTKEP